MPSSADWPVPYRSLKVSSVRDSLTAITGQVSLPSCSSRRSRSSPLRVSSAPPRTGRSQRCSSISRSAPSSRVMSGPHSARAPTCLAYISASSPRVACTGTPLSTSAAATSSCTVSGLAEHSAACAPPATSACIRFAVSAVTCRQAATFAPASGRSAAKRSRIERSTGICPSAHSTRARPPGASDGSWISLRSVLVAIVVALERPVDRHADVGRLVGAQLGQASSERVQMQARDLLVEVLGQHVDLLLVLVVLGEQLDLGDRLVRERVRHHEARVAGRVAEVQQAALGEDDDRVAVGEGPLVDLRL